MPPAAIKSNPITKPHVDMWDEAMNAVVGSTSTSLELEIEK